MNWKRMVSVSVVALQQTESTYITVAREHRMIRMVLYEILSGKDTSVDVLPRPFGFDVSKKLARFLRANRLVRKRLVHNLPDSGFNTIRAYKDVASCRGSVFER